MRRKPSTLLPLEMSILETGLHIQGAGGERFHGFRLASVMREREGARRLTAHGTLYKALARMERAGLVESEWEDPLVAAEEGRPRRRLYRVTLAGARALQAGEREQADRSGATAKAGGTVA